ncbi:MAG TPA: hypothetical protein DDW41_06115 [Candidatus Andersenbacteria bacterium]|nr:hypothetical protein [Candidatus Andersenbacteria bacterium]
MQKIYSKIKNLVTKVRDGLFLASSRSYGEQYVEPFIREKYELSEPKTNDNDGTDKDGKRYEIKSCKVLRATSNGKKLKTILDRILFETENVETGRLIPFSECETAKYLANVQNVKRDYFDYLLYVLLFEDCVKVFSAKREEIGTGIFPSWSDKHGRYDAHGKSGQFPVTKSTIRWHLDNHLKDTVSYEEMKDVYTKLSA